ncbi:polysaccharide deacetylase family protein [Aureliella helgolandensis]|uniref:Polysaccharide deacetylase n=1 Tax=Aureliella helgolandensis TaxID=2527968 RepID=A0A518G806_9BACT|nr:polysaccharide deacetylase family protein [Aureliella helgolandensis]QDV24721.1 Polysaccharide deacetylase [Aureliella helgolandensis]
MNKLSASLSLDLDNKWSYLKTHGDEGWESFPSYLDSVVPFVLEILSDLNLTITVFVIGQDAILPKNHGALAQIAKAGHEIGNHSFHHEPWLHLYSEAKLSAEFTAAEEAIHLATGKKTIGFRGPGFSFSPSVLRCLADRGYLYDASTFPTYLGPVARAYYFLSTQLDDEKRSERKNLFGSFTEGFRPLKPYRWEFPAGSQTPPLIEIPVTTIPWVRVPFHLSYLLYLASYSETLAWAYWKFALTCCRISGVAPSLLLHPLDFLGGDEELDLSFFPAMGLKGTVKRAFAKAVLADFARVYEVVPMADFAHQIDRLGRLKARPVPAAPPLAKPTGTQPVRAEGLR